ncbi:MAG TPA: PPC domain-containing DNA-binding protein [Bryobacteraceae bacterium]|nr:PPC domain-containing DNA-binding protein [Bryobacteraceae bacterium]
MLRTLLIFAVLAAALVGQETRQEVIKATTPEQDSKPNSDKVPDVYALTGNFSKVAVLRFKYQADLLAGLEKAIKQQGIRNGVILAGAGSVTGYQIHTVSNRTFPSKNLYVKNPTQPADIISMNGYVIDGRLHAHMTMATPDKAFGGHLEPGTKVFTFAIITVGVMNDVDLSRVDDKTYR